ncbi:hypothetical protein [Streptomyces sp. SAS_275]|uniref:hypothetical protein n=1 Tax=Streptomyces sp. SAS_275 TaxID=3412746 RepID=UPI00403CAAC1
MRFRLRRRHREEPQSGERCGVLKPSFFEHTYETECVLCPQHSGSHVDEHGTRWRFIAVPAKDGDVCGTYQVPARSEDSGLCAGCGMSDYKHREQPK